MHTHIINFSYLTLKKHTHTLQMQQDLSRGLVIQSFDIVPLSAPSWVQRYKAVAIYCAIISC